MKEQLQSLRKVLIVPLVLASLVLSACGGGGGAAPQQKSAAAPTTAPAPTAAPAQAAPAQLATAPAAPAAQPAKPAAAAAGSAATPAPVVNMGVANNMQNTPWFIGVDKGIFLKNGIDLKLKVLNSGAEIAKALQVGEIEVGVASLSVHAAAQSQDIRHRGFAFVLNDAVVRNPDNHYAIIAHPNSSITKLEDLSGKTVGTSLGTSQDTYLRVALSKAGIPADGVQFVNANPGNIPAAFAGGTEVVVTLEPYGEIIMAQHPGAKLLQRGGGIIAQRVAVTAPDEWLAANRPLAEKLIAGMVEACFITRTQPEVSGDVVPRWLSGTEAAIATKAIKHMPFDPRVSKFVEESWNDENRVLVEQKKIKEPVPFGQAFDLTLSENIPTKYAQFLADLKPLP